MTNSVSDPELGHKIARWLILMHKSYLEDIDAPEPEDYRPHPEFAEVMRWAVHTVPDRVTDSEWERYNFRVFFPDGERPRQ